MNKSIAILFSILIVGSTISGCFSGNGDSTEDDIDESLQTQIDDLEIKLEQNLFDLDELSKSLNESNNNVIMLSELFANNSSNQDGLAFILEENMSQNQNLSTQVVDLLQRISELQLQIQYLEQELETTVGYISNTPKLLVITVDVEAGHRCSGPVSNDSQNDRISTCMYGIFGDQRAGIIEMMDIADEVGVKISFFVDVLEVYAYGDKVIQVMQDIDSRGHDVQLHFHPSMINSTNWELIQNSEAWNQSGATKETFMTCWDQDTANFWFTHAMEIFDEANITRPIAYRSGAYRYCDTTIQAMSNSNMSQSYNYNLYSSGRQNFNAGYLHNFQWENEVFEFPITYVEDENGVVEASSRIDGTTWYIPVNETFERYYGNQSSTRVMTMILHSFSFLNLDEDDKYYLKDQTKVETFRLFMHNLSDEYTIVSASQLQTYIDNGSIEGEFKLPLRFLENECRR